MFNVIPASRLNRDMDVILNSFFAPVTRNGHSPRGEISQGRLPVNVRETEEKYVVEAEIPGLALDEIEVSVMDNELTIRAERKEESEEKDTNYLRRERSVGSVERVLSFGKDVDAEKIEASLKNGILTVHLPKGVAAKPRRIEVTTTKQ